MCWRTNLCGLSPAAVEGNGAEQIISGSNEVLGPCWAVATSGVLVREQLFNVSICHYNRLKLLSHGEFSKRFSGTSDIASLEVAAPILIIGMVRRPLEMSSS
ncbi:uncharacterized protein LOC114761966 [Neltuma alba]|uniref:uncharacterized protein LOC114761966 n=1 Tax=Neltuma alba TaxID=207710 RepID=UPI0010A591A6|nr:uncharacterized protein LOC114761966 [Prosopis alba]